MAGQAAAATRVVLHLPTGARTFDEQQLGDDDVLSEDYVLRSPSSEEHETLSGISVQRLLEKAGYAPQQGFLRMSRADGTWATLSAADVGDPSPFADGRKPIVFLDSDRVRYFRPVRDATDINGRDNIATDPGQPLDIWVQTGAPLAVTASASPGNVAAGTRVTFTASVGGARGGEAVTVHWRFDDGSTATGTTVRHSFATEGVYGVVATAQGDQGSGGASEPANVTVGAPPKSRGPGSAGGTKTKGPHTGPSKGPAKGAGGGRTTAGGDATPAPAPAATATPAAASPPAPETTPAPAATPAPSRPRAARRAKRARPPVERGELVRGVLVSSSAPLPLPATVVPPSAGSRAAAGARSSAAGISLGVLAVLLLLAAGAWRERPRARRMET